MSNIPVRGINELNRAFQLARSETTKRLPVLLRGAIRPVETGAERNAATIGTGVPWSQQRSVASRSMAYIAPVKRGTRVAQRKRQKFARRLITRAMEPSLNANREQVGRSFDELLARIERQFNRG